MDDANMLAADCIVISCCCQCMILQILVFILFKLPNKVLKKAKEYAKKFRARNKGTKILEIEMARLYEDDSFRSLGKSFGIDVDDLCTIESIGFGCCMDEIERVLEEFSDRGEFAFGSFWGGEVCSSRRSFRLLCKEDVIGYDDVRSRLMDFFGDVDFTYR